MLKQQEVVHEGGGGRLHFPNSGWLVVKDRQHRSVRRETFHCLDCGMALVWNSRGQRKDPGAREKRPTNDCGKEQTDHPTQGTLRTKQARSREGARLGLSFPDLESANRAVAAGLAAGGALVSLVPHRETLEDFFVRRLEEGRAAGCATWGGSPTCSRRASAGWTW